MVLGGDAAGIIIALPTSKVVLADVEYQRRGFEIGDNVVGVSKSYGLRVRELMLESS